MRRINVVTESTHARRTCLLFQKALGKHVQGGIIAAPNPDYDKERWWRYSEGVKDVMSDNLSYVYAKFSSGRQNQKTEPQINANRRFEPDERR